MHNISRDAALSKELSREQVTQTMQIQVEHILNVTSDIIKGYVWAFWLYIK
jgi:predicted phage-related endonuclease